MTDSQPARGSHCGPCNLCHGSGHEWSHEIQGWGATCTLCGGKGIQHFPPAADAFAMLREKYGHMFNDVKLEREEEPVAGGGGEVVTAELVGEERMYNDAMAHAMVEFRMTKDDAIRALLADRDRLIKCAVDVEKTRPRMYGIGSADVTDEMVRAASESCAKDDEGEFPPLCDLINYSGENKTRTVIRAALVAALQVKP